MLTSIPNSARRRCLCSSPQRQIKTPLQSPTAIPQQPNHLTAAGCGLAGRENKRVLVRAHNAYVGLENKLHLREKEKQNNLLASMAAAAAPLKLTGEGARSSAVTPHTPGSPRREARPGQRHEADACPAPHQAATGDAFKAISAATPPAITRCPPAERQQGRVPGREPAGAEAGRRPRHPRRPPGPRTARHRPARGSYGRAFGRSGPKRGCRTAARGGGPAAFHEAGSRRGASRASPAAYSGPIPHETAQLSPAARGYRAGCRPQARAPPLPTPPAAPHNRPPMSAPDRGVANQGAALIHPPPGAAGRGSVLPGPAPRAQPSAQHCGCVSAALLPAVPAAPLSAGRPPGPATRVSRPHPQSAQASAHPLSLLRRRGATYCGYRGRARKTPGGPRRTPVRPRRRGGGLGRGRRGAGVRPHKGLRARPGPAVS